jgi:hypothetical protein
MVFMRKELKYQKNKNNKNPWSPALPKNKENLTAPKKGSCLDSSVATPSNLSYIHSAITAVCHYEREIVKKEEPRRPPKSSIKTKMEKISSSRAFEMFSKVFQNENIGKAKDRIEATRETVGQGKYPVAGEEGGDGEGKGNTDPKGTGHFKRHISVGPHTFFTKKAKQHKSVFLEEDNFELVGW